MTEVEKPLDLEGVIPISLIRQHTKTDDDIRVTDELLALYRKGAIEAAEAFTGRTWGRIRTVSVPVDMPSHASRFNRQRAIRLRDPVYDGIVTLTGGNLLHPIRINTARGARKIVIPIVSETLDGSCCYPCGARENYGMIATYRTGVSCGEEIPQGVVIGCLKFIAWQIGNPGDQLVTMNDGNAAGRQGVGGTNNAIAASGAAEQWRIYRER